jgi:hypothetical protein
LRQAHRRAGGKGYGVGRPTKTEGNDFTRPTWNRFYAKVPGLPRATQDHSRVLGRFIVELASKLDKRLTIDLAWP